MKTIVWDIDDVLNDLQRSWLDVEWNGKHPGRMIKYAQLTVNPPHDLLKIDIHSYRESLDAFRLSARAGTMKPDPQVYNWFTRYGHLFRHVALTARNIGTVSVAIQWLLDHFGQWFQTIAFIPSERRHESPKQPDRRKVDYLVWLNRADYYIDDNSINVREASAIGVCAFLVSQPWNNSQQTLCQILRIINENEGLVSHDKAF